MKIYTRTGDDGTTGLGSRRRVGKDSLRIETYGTVDELNSVLGVVLAVGVPARLKAAVFRVQEELFCLGSDLCVPEEDKEQWQVPKIEPHHVQALEDLMDELELDLMPLKNFILPGGSIPAAHLHVARTVARRCERLLVALGREETIDPCSVHYLNRLSDALFVMARWVNGRVSRPDIIWKAP